MKQLKGLSAFLLVTDSLTSVLERQENAQVASDAIRQETRTRNLEESKLARDRQRNKEKAKRREARTAATAERRLLHPLARDMGPKRRKARPAKGLYPEVCRKTLARKCGLHHVSVSRILSGRMGANKETICRLAYLLGVTPRILSDRLQELRSQCSH